MTNVLEGVAAQPWQSEDWQRFISFGPRMPHALLFSGVAGLGKLGFALQAAQHVLCGQDNAPCGVCDNCRLFNAGSHPDLHLVFSERLALLKSEPLQRYASRYLEDFDKAKKRKPRRIIAVDQIRELIQNAALAHHSAEHKVVVIAPAEDMNTNAANALLKLLEEPPTSTIILLVSHQPEALPITIRSRCVPFALSLPAARDASTWLGQQAGVDTADISSALQLASGAPLAALALLENQEVDQFSQMLAALNQLVSGQVDAIATSDKLTKLVDSPRLLQWMQAMLAQGARDGQGAGQDKGAAASYLSAHPTLQNKLKALSPSALFKFYDFITEFKRHDVEQLNPQLLAEQVLIKFSSLCARA